MALAMKYKSVLYYSYVRCYYWVKGDHSGLHSTLLVIFATS